MFETTNQIYIYIYLKEINGDKPAKYKWLEIYI